jgi:serine/threonine protein kinase
LTEVDGDIRSINHSAIPAIGHWAIGHRLGEGSQGNVFHATSITHQFDFAVKCLRGERIDAFENLSKDALTEIENMSSINHPHIVQCYGAEIVRGKLYIFMEYCSYGSLAKHIANQRRLTEEDAKGITKQLLEAVNYLHSRQRRPMMHRDIKAGNILISELVTGTVPTIKLCDFGSSTRFLRDDYCGTNRGLRKLSPAAAEVVPDWNPLCSVNTIDMKKLLSCTIKGTCNWIAPEVLKGNAYSVGCDIWSLGCTLIEMLTGSLPWKLFDNPLAGMLNIMNSSQTPLDLVDSEILRSLSDNCIALLRKCLERDPSKRWSAKRLLRHPWFRVSLEAIPATPVGAMDNLFSPTPLKPTI